MDDRRDGFCASVAEAAAVRSACRALRYSVDARKKATALVGSSGNTGIVTPAQGARSSLNLVCIHCHKYRL